MRLMNKLIKMLVLFSSIIIMGLSLNCEKASASEVVVCEPYEVEVCSICGNDYNDGSVCLHHKGTTYDSTVCEPIDDQLCNICHSDYSCCTHTEGSEYGGQVCRVLRTCSICGNDYDDPTVCPHKAGQSYGGEECSTYIVEMCNICGNNYNNGEHCEHIRGQVYEDGACYPTEQVTCSICDNDYNDPSVCPHKVGQWYDSEECVVIGICSICGNDYNDPTACPHKVGQTYGAVTCEPYYGQICNICGNDYRDSYWCPHKQGETYGGTVCTTTTIEICNICGNNYSNRNACTHKRKEIYTIEKTIEKAKLLIEENRENIIAAAKCYDVDAGIIAACIYTEQCKNINFCDGFDVMGPIMLGVDTSIGIGQVKYSTAKLVEKEGYYNNDIADRWNTIPIVNDSTMQREVRLLDERTNIFYVAGYLRYFIDLWKTEFPTISERVDILATLYNLGEKKTSPNPNPKSNKFGDYAKENYEMLKYLLKIYE